MVVLVTCFNKSLYQSRENIFYPEMSESIVISARDGKLSVLNMKIVEIRKKIQLSEGQRKANFEGCEAKKDENAEKISRLKKDVQELQGEHTESGTNVINTKRIPDLSYEASTRFKHRSLASTLMIHDEINTRLRKELDRAKYSRKKQQYELSRTLREHEELMSGKSEEIVRKKSEYSLDKKIINLENQLHRINVLQMEVDTVHTKYECVQSSLKMDSACYTSTLDKLGQNIEGMENEIEQLQGAREQALQLRETTKKTLMIQETAAMNTSMEHDITIMDYRKRVEDRKLELERLERMMFPAIRPTPRDNLDATEKIGAQRELDRGVSKDVVHELKEIFIKLRSAAGVTEKGDVSKRFFEQRITKDKLQRMRTTTEEEKALLEKRRQQLSAEVEIEKFSETEDTEQNIEELKNIMDSIVDRRFKQRKAINKKKIIQDHSNEIIYKVWKLYDELQGCISIPGSGIESQPRDPALILEILKNEMKNKLADIKDLADFPVVPDKLSDNLVGLSVESGNYTSGEIYAEEHLLSPLFSIVTTPAAVQLQLSEDEDEIPSRSWLKRQAQLLVDTKSRRKGFIFKR